MKSWRGRLCEVMIKKELWKFWKGRIGEDMKGIIGEVVKMKNR